jgi:hypothetical protein
MTLNQPTRSEHKWRENVATTGCELPHVASCRIPVTKLEPSRAKVKPGLPRASHDALKCTSRCVCGAKAQLKHCRHVRTSMGTQPGRKQAYGGIGLNHVYSVAFGNPAEVASISPSVVLAGLLG